MHAKSTKGIRIAKSDLFSFLHLVVLGMSSPLCEWDAHSQSFVQVLDVSDSLVRNGMSRRFVTPEPFMLCSNAFEVSCNVLLTWVPSCVG